MAASPPTAGSPPPPTSPDPAPDPVDSGPSSAEPVRFLPTASWEALEARARLLRRLRQFFDSRGFLEVTTPLLSQETVSDPQIESFEVHSPLPLPAGRWFLQTSPEFHMKRLLAAGGKAIYQVTQAFRAGETGPIHNPEFTICEWYRVGDDMAGGMALLDQLMQALVGTKPAERISYAGAFREATGLDPLGVTVEELKSSEFSPFRECCEDRDDWLQLIFATHVQPRLGGDVPLFVTHFPASQAALARLAPGDPRVAERFELFFRGAELANGYHELTDAEEFQSRFAAGNAVRRSRNRPEIPWPGRFAACLRKGLPPSTGVALGFDRLVMACLGLSAIELVVPFLNEES